MINPNGTIHDHDVYAQSEAKDDQFQEHEYYMKDAVYIYIKY